jgi:hypothetical protein
MSGCTKHLEITPTGHTIVDLEPSQGAIHAYPRLSPTRTEEGPFLAIFFLARLDLEPVALKWTYHLYYELLPCTQNSHGYDLYSGKVYVATKEEIKTQLHGSEKSDLGLYKIHIPLQMDKIKRNAEGFGALNVQTYLDRARKDGLCFRVGGGQMSGISMFSDVVKAPLVMRDNSLIVLQDTLHQ